MGSQIGSSIYHPAKLVKNGDLSHNMEIIVEDTEGQEALFFFFRQGACQSGYTVCVPVSTRTVMRSKPHLEAHLMAA